MPDIDSISREFTGLARTARARLLAAAELSTPKMRAICEDVLADFARRNHGPRVETLIETERAWRKLPAAERIALEITRDRKSLTIVDIRVTASNITHLPTVGEVAELALCVVGNTLAIGQRRVERSAEALATLSLHGLSRWQQRAFVTTDAALLADLQTLLRAHGVFDQPRPGFAVTRHTR